MLLKSAAGSHKSLQILRHCKMNTSSRSRLCLIEKFRSKSQNILSFFRTKKLNKILFCESTNSESKETQVVNQSRGELLPTVCENKTKVPVEKRAWRLNLFT